MADETTRRPRARAALLLIVTFVLGMVCGAALFHLGQLSVHRALAHGRAIAFSHDPLDRFSRHLDLDDEQKQRIGEILHRDREQIHAVLDRSRDEIRSMLGPDQLAEFDRMHKPPLMRPGPPGPPPGPHLPHGPRGPKLPRPPEKAEPPPAE